MSNQNQGRYWLFAGLRYYPDGGFLDLKGCFASEAEARTAAKSVRIEGYNPPQPPDWAHIVDSETRTIVWRKGD